MVNSFIKQIKLKSTPEQPKHRNEHQWKPSLFFETIFYLTIRPSESIAEWIDMNPIPGQASVF